MNEIEVKFVKHRDNHHSSHSGYDRIVDYLGSCVEMVDLERRRSRVVPARLANIMWRRAGISDYGYNQFYMEVSAGLEMLKAKNQVFHFLYGEHWYRYLGLLNGLRGNRVVASFHFPPDKLWESLKHQTHLQRLQALITVGRNQIPALESVVGPGKTHFIPHGIDTDFFCPPSTKLKHEPPTCLFVGVHLRDYQTLRRTIQIVQQRCADVRFTVVTFESEFKHLADLPAANLRCKVPEQELLTLYQQADLLLLPLHDCTANNAILEALACGLPIISTDIGAVQDYVDESSALLFPPKSADEMADAVLTLLSDDTRRKDMALAARKQALAFSWPAIAAQFLDLYRTLLTE